MLDESYLLQGTPNGAPRCSTCMPGRHSSGCSSLFRFPISDIFSFFSGFQGAGRVTSHPKNAQFRFFLGFQCAGRVISHPKNAQWWAHHRRGRFTSVAGCCSSGCSSLCMFLVSNTSFLLCYKFLVPPALFLLCLRSVRCPTIHTSP